MALAVPVAVKFLQWGRGTLGRTMSNYLSLAAVSQAELLAEHTEAIVTSILQGGLWAPGVEGRQPWSAWGSGTGNPGASGL